MTTFFTIGYEGSALPDFIATLQSAGVEHLLDVRELPQSRRPGFSKRSLSEALAKEAISYSHIKQLGDPKNGRDAARRGEMDEFRAIFEAHLDLPASKIALEEAAEAITQQSTVLMCYERNPKDCHRSLVAKRLLSSGHLEVQHLGVQSHVVRRTAAVAAVASGYA